MRNYDDEIRQAREHAGEPRSADKALVWSIVREGLGLVGRHADVFTSSELDDVAAALTDALAARLTFAARRA